MHPVAPGLRALIQPASLKLHSHAAPPCVCFATYSRILAMHPAAPGLHAPSQGASAPPTRGGTASVAAAVQAFYWPECGPCLRRASPVRQPLQLWFHQGRAMWGPQCR